MKNWYCVLFLLVLCCTCINRGGLYSWAPTGKKYAEGVSGKTPAEFKLMKGREAFNCKISDGKNYKGEEVTKLCFRDSTYGDIARDEGEIYIHGNREGSDIETKINLLNVEKIEVLKKDKSRLFVKETNSGELFFRIRVTFNTGKPPETLVVNPQLAVAFHRVGVGHERVFLYKIDSIDNIKPDKVPRYHNKEEREKRYKRGRAGQAKALW